MSKWAAQDRSAMMALIRSFFTSVSIPVIRGETVFLRTPKLNDHSDWAKLRSESREFLIPWEPVWQQDEFSIRAFKRRLKKYELELRNGRGMSLFIFKVCDNCLVGGLTLSNIRRGVAQSCTLGYWMGEKYAGQGLMREAINAMLPFIFEKLKLHRLEAACMPDNERSMGLLNSIGFNKEGYAKEYLKINGKWQDHVLFAFNGEEWKTKSKWKTKNDL